MFSRSVKLPTTLKEYDELVARLVKKYDLKDAHHAAALLSLAITHLPQHQYRVKLSYLGDYIRKNIANHVANHKSQTLRHEAQIDQLINALTIDPSDVQARDAIDQAINQGSEYAKKAMEKLIAHPPAVIPNPILETLKIVPTAPPAIPSPPGDEPPTAS